MVYVYCFIVIGYGGATAYSIFIFSFLNTSFYLSFFLSLLSLSEFSLSSLFALGLWALSTPCDCLGGCVCTFEPLVQVFRRAHRGRGARVVGVF